MRRYGEITKRESRGKRSRYYSVRVSDGGRRSWVCTGRTSLAAAREQVRTWELADARGELDRVEQVDLDIAWGQWLARQDVSPRWMAELTRIAGTLCEALRVQGARRVDEVRISLIEDALLALTRERGWGGATAIRHGRVAQAFFRWARRRQYTGHDPAIAWEAPSTWKRDAARGQYRGTALTVEQARLLLSACRRPYDVVYKPKDRAAYVATLTPPGHLYVAVMIALRSGLRLGNIVGPKALCWRNLRDDMTTIDLPGDVMKSGMRLLIPVHPELRHTLLAWLKARPETPYPDSPVLFKAAHAQCSRISRSFRAALDRAGLSVATTATGERVQFRFHDLRHTFATWVAAVAPEQIKRALLGHSARDVSSRYTHLTVEQMRPHLEALERLEQVTLELPMADVEGA